MFSIKTVSIVLKVYDFNLSGHHVISLVEQPGTLHTNRMLINHQTPTNKWHCSVRKNIILPILGIEESIFSVLKRTVCAPLLKI